jgi:hypothetical protein
MDLIEGPTLAEVVKQEGVRSPTEAALIGRDLCRAMAAVHATDIVHRDIKAQNVIRQSQTGQIILMDFGAGEAMDADRATRRPTGTPLYLAPELFDGRVATRETDIYALGVLLFHLVTRSYPVLGEDMRELQLSHRRGDRHHLGDMRPDLPDDFVRVVETMIAPDPAKRFHSATEVRKALEEVVAPRPEPIPPPPKPNPWIRRAYLATVSIVTTVAALVVIGAVSTHTFDMVFNRGDFNPESPVRSTLGFGWQTVSAPLIRVTVYMMAAMLVAAVARVFCRLAPPVGKTTSRATGACRRFLEDRELYDPVLLLQITAGIGALAFAAVAFAQWDNATIIALSIDTASPDRLAALQPANEPRYDVLQRLLELVLFAYVLVVSNVYVHTRREERHVPVLTAVYVVAVPAIAVLLMRAMPYRVMYANGFRRVDYDSVRCYEIGEKPGWVRLFCPDQNPPRVKDYKENDPRLHDRNITERVFTPRSEAAVFDATSP